VCATYYAWKQEYVPGERYTGGAGQRATGPDMRAFGALRAIDPATGERRWEFQYISPSTAGVLTTASGLVFSGDAEGNFLAFDSHAGKLLWRFQMGSALHGTSPITYMLDGRQQLLVPAGGTLTAWALGDVPRVPSTR
jgi:outer membrane protein assembly factor BamB